MTLHTFALTPSLVPETEVARDVREEGALEVVPPEKRQGWPGRKRPVAPSVRKDEEEPEETVQPYLVVLTPAVLRVLSRVSPVVPLLRLSGVPQLVRGFPSPVVLDALHVNRPVLPC